MTTRVQFYAGGSGELRCSITRDRPAPGAIIRAIGGVTVVRRDPPNRPGAEWIAPYAVNCAAHGRIVSRATTDQASAEAYAHLNRAHRAPAMACPMCDSRDMARPYDNGHTSTATDCRACGALMCAEAATPGTQANTYIRGNRTA